jgi:hypothetical protein
MNQILISVLLMASGEPTLTDLSAGSPELKRPFEKANGHVRLVLLLSPG